MRRVLNGIFLCVTITIKKHPQAVNLRGPYRNGVIRVVPVKRQVYCATPAVNLLFLSTIANLLADWPHCRLSDLFSEVSM